MKADWLTGLAAVAEVGAVQSMIEEYARRAPLSNGPEMVFESGGFISGAVAPTPVMQLADWENHVDIHVVYQLLPRV